MYEIIDTLKAFSAETRSVLERIETHFRSGNPTPEFLSGCYRDLGRFLEPGGDTDPGALLSEENMRITARILEVDRDRTAAAAAAFVPIEEMETVATICRDAGLGDEAVRIQRVHDWALAIRRWRNAAFFNRYGRINF